MCVCVRACVHACVWMTGCAFHWADMCKWSECTIALLACLSISREGKSGLHCHNYDPRSMHIMQKMCSVFSVLSCRPINVDCSDIMQYM